MPLEFDPVTGLKAPDTDEIRANVVSDWVAAFEGDGQPPLNTDPSTPAGQLIDAEVAEIEAKNADMLYLANQFNPRVAEGRWQDAIGNIYFLTRKTNEPSVVTCTVTGLNGTVIPYGAIVRDDAGNALICNRAVTIGPTGTAETTFRTTETGPIDIPAGAVTTIVTTIPGWDSVANESAGVVGRNVETRADFEARRYGSVAKNAHGSVSAIYGALSDISGTDGVLDVQVLENIGPNPIVKYGVTVPGHGITICIYGGADEDIARVIYQKKDAGCDTGGNTPITYTAADYHGAVYNYLILRPTPVNFWVRVTLGDSDTVTPAIEAAVKEAIYTDFLGENLHTQQPRVGLAQDVYASRFYHAVTAIDGVTNLLSVDIALSDNPSNADYTSLISINGDQEPVISLDQITIVLAAV